VEIPIGEANKELSRRFTEMFSTGDVALANEILSPRQCSMARPTMASFVALMR
jgi:hypothetical protein